MHRELLISAGPGEWRAALLEDGVPVELFVERGDRTEIGSIHLGRVRRLAPALGAALVDIGGDRPAFLPQADIVPRGKQLHEGERVLAQISREAQGGKAPRVTMAATLRGDRVELIIGRAGLQGEERLSDEERAQLLGRSETGEGNATGLRLRDLVSIDEISTEVAALARRWRDIVDCAAQLAPPARIDPLPTFACALAGRLQFKPAQIYVDNPGIIPQLRAAFPAASAEHRSEAEWPIELDAVFDQALLETVALPGSGAVHFEMARTAVLIDVDTGTPETGAPERVGLAANLAAAGTIARQIRLRSLGGGAVIDFVGLERRASRERVRAVLAGALARDPERPQILGWTRLGHLELVRPRRRRPLAEGLLEARLGGARVKTAATVAYEGLRALRREARAQPGLSWRLSVAPDVAAALTGEAAPAVKDATERFARKLAIETDPGYGRDRFQIARM
jgi:ribonuclease G